MAMRKSSSWKQTRAGRSGPQAARNGKRAARNGKRAARAGKQSTLTPALGAKRTAARSEALALGATLTISDVGDCRRALLQTDAARLDARALRVVDTAGLQLLLAAGRAAQRRGERLAIDGAAGLLSGAAASLGLETALAAVLDLSA